MTVQPTFSETAACFLCSAVSSTLSSSRIARAQCVVVCLIALCSLTSFVDLRRGARGCDGTAATRATNSIQRLLLRPGEVSDAGDDSASSDRLRSQAAPSARPSSARASKCPRVTIFSAPTAYNVSSYSHRRALMSWLRLDPTPRVVLLGAHPSLASVAAEFPNHVSVDADVDTNLEGTPLLNSVLARIQAFGTVASAADSPSSGSASGSASSSASASASAAASPHCDIVMLVDPDVLLFNDVLFAARRLASRFSSFVMLSAPWDVHTFRFSLDGLPPHIHPSVSSTEKPGTLSYRSSAASRGGFPSHPATAPAVNGVNEEEIRDYVRQRGRLNVIAGATVLMWNRPAAPLLHPSIAIPPFFLGRGNYLRWLVARAAGSLPASASSSNGSGNANGNVTAQVARAASELEAADEAGVPAAVRDDPESRYAVDATDAVTAVRVFSALDAQREAQLAVEKRRDETVAAVLCGGIVGGRGGSGGLGALSRLARSFLSRQAPQRRRLLSGAEAGRDGAESPRAGRTHNSISRGGGSFAGESSSLGQSLWQPLPGRNAKRWEVYANAHMAQVQWRAGGFSSEGGSISHAPWRLAPCFEPGGESMCLMRRRRPGNCSCEHTPFVGRSTGDTRPHDANWLSCGHTGAENDLDADLLRDLRSAPDGADSTLSSLEADFGLGLEDMGGVGETRLRNGLILPTTAGVDATLIAKNATKASTAGKRSPLLEKEQPKTRTAASVGFWKGTEGLPYTLEQLLPIVASEQQAVILLASSFEDREAAMNSICRLRNLGMSNYMLAALDARMYAYAFLQGIPVFMHKTPIANQSVTAAAAAAATPTSAVPFPASATQASNNTDSDDTSSASRLASVAPVLMMRILRLGYSVLWADVHTVWFSNPLPHLLSLDSNTLAVQSMEPDMHRAPNAARTIGAGLMFARPSHLSLKALGSVVAYMAAARAEAGEEGGSMAGSAMEGEGEVEEYRAFHDVLCGEGSKLKIGKDLCRWKNGFRVVFLDRGLFPAGTIKGIWDAPPSLGGLDRACKRLGCVAVQNSGIRGRGKRAEQLGAHGLVAYDSWRRMCIRSWRVEQRAEQVQRKFM
ncbi:hypothetical protein CLOM_g15871 [Closterium sp. NIES-68]|nr:hypothetical protein CLOM_g15871 [Closterium sp. NIES-68]GJP80984.1 hypothetical protein CLOP_g11173 [Closterium sp. NIES-67]